MTAIQSTREVVQRAFDSLNDQDREAFVELHADDAVLHASDEEFRGMDAIVAYEFGFIEAFPDLTLTIDAMVAEGDTVAVRWTLAGTHEGEFNGIDSTGEEIEIPVMGMFRVKADHITEVWLQSDTFELMRQLGVVESASVEGPAR